MPRVIEVTPAIPACSDPGPQPEVKFPTGAELTDIILTQSDNLLAAWDWMDKSERCLEALRAARRLDSR